MKVVFKRLKVIRILWWICSKPAYQTFPQTSSIMKKTNKEMSDPEKSNTNTIIYWWLPAVLRPIFQVMKVVFKRSTQGRGGKDVSPIFFGFLKEASWAIFSVESLMARPGVPIIMAEFDDVHLTILR
jgi:hypothetical protein